MKKTPLQPGKESSNQPCPLSHNPNSAQAIIDTHSKLEEEKSGKPISNKPIEEKPDQAVIISPIGEIDLEVCKFIENKIQTIFNIKAMTIPLLPDIAFAYDTTRKQYHSTPILKKLEENAPGNCMKIVGITEVDLFIPILTYVYGEAQLGGKACIISTHRLHGSPENESYTKVHERVIKEAIHELGHTFSLRHCENNTCTMHYCRSLEDVDMKSDQLCRYCKVMLTDEIKIIAKR